MSSAAGRSPSGAPLTVRSGAGRRAPLCTLGAALCLAACGEPSRRLRSIDEVYAETFRRFDQDGDGGLSEAELLRTDPTGSMRRMDADNDGRVTVAELRQWTELTHPRPPMIKPIGEGGEREPEGPPPAPSLAQGPPIPGVPQGPPVDGAPQGPPQGAGPLGPATLPPGALPPPPPGAPGPSGPPGAHPSPPAPQGGAPPTPGGR